MINRTKALVLSQFVFYWIAVAVLLIAARPIAEEVGGLPSGRASVDIAAVLVLTALLTLLSIGVIRGWRWFFWLLLIAFLAGIFRLPIAALELAGILPQRGPDWYVVFTAVVGLAQFGIALVMLAGYRKSGIWGNP